MASWAPISKTGIKCKLLSIQGKLDIMSPLNATLNFHHKKIIASELCISAPT
jgi:hypothetical protein